jgi:segregation and condensation protein A
MSGRSAGTAERPAADPTPGFELHLDNFEGPFDLLLSLIAKHKLDITEVSLSQVTDDFIAFVKVGGKAWDLEQTTSFLLVASTLLDLKAARLLPQGDVEDEEDLALLEARDLLFARLLQYKAFKHAAGWISERLVDEAESFPRQAGLEAHFAALLPELVFKTTPEMLAQLALTALAPKEEAPPAEVGVAHLHGGAVSVREQAGILALMLQENRTLSFTELTADADSHLVVVARFLALLEMYRERVVSFSQNAPLDTLQVTWSETADDWNTVNLREEYEAAAPEGAAGTVPPTSEGEPEA